MTSRPILLVEDNPDDVELTLHAFKKSEIANTVVVARDGVEALERLLPPDGTPGLEPAVVLLDLKLPRVDGHEVLRRIRDDPRTRLLPVVILTSSSEDRDMTWCYENGANSYISKPVDFPEFLEVASLLCRYWLVLNRPPTP